jgi:hypothetical protein
MTVLDLSTISTTSLVYDVIDRAGEIIERVTLPPGRTLVAVGPANYVYLAHPIAPKQMALELARITR